MLVQILPHPLRPDLLWFRLVCHFKLPIISEYKILSLPFSRFIKEKKKLLFTKKQLHPDNTHELKLRRSATMIGFSGQFLPHLFYLRNLTQHFTRVHHTIITLAFINYCVIVTLDLFLSTPSSTLISPTPATPQKTTKLYCHTYYYCFTHLYF